MITRFGMSKKFGLMGLATVESQYLDGRASLTCSDVTAADIDTEVMKLLHDSYKKAKKLLKENREIMDKLEAHLIEKETITGKEFMKIFRKEKGIPEPKKDEKETERFKDKKEEPVAGEKSPEVSAQMGQNAADGQPIPGEHSGTGQNTEQPGFAMTQQSVPEQSGSTGQPESSSQQQPSGNRGLFSQVPDRKPEENE